MIREKKSSEKPISVIITLKSPTHTLNSAIVATKEPTLDDLASLMRLILNISTGKYGDAVSQRVHDSMFKENPN